MKNYTFNWEVQTLLEQFVGAFNDIIIKRYDNNNTLVGSASGEKVLFVYSPKQRVFNNLNSPAAGGLTVPVIAINISGISRDSTRVFNKNEGFLVDYKSTEDNSSLLKKIPQPVPINIKIDMTIISRYQNDMDQILANFIPYCDPYIVISWKLPSLNKSTIPYEIRSEVLWDGNINLQYPDNLGATQPYRISATTSFIIKGWMFKKMDEYINKIYNIESKYITSDGETSEDLTQITNPILLQSYFDFSKNVLAGTSLSQITVAQSDTYVNWVIGNSATVFDINTIVMSSSSLWNSVYANVNSLSSIWNFSAGGDFSAVIDYIANNDITIGGINSTGPILSGSVDLLDIFSNVGNQNLEFNQTNNELTITNGNTVALNSLSYDNIKPSNNIETIQEFAATNPQSIYKGFTVTLNSSKRVYVFAGDNPSNANHYLELNLNPYTPIYKELSLNDNKTLVDSFYLGDFKTAKYTLQVETSFNNEIYYSELNVAGSVQDNTGVVSEYGLISTSNIILGYTVEVIVNNLFLYLNHNTDNDNSHFLIVKGLRTNHYRI